MPLPKSRFRSNPNHPYSLWPFQVKTVPDKRLPNGWAPVRGWVDHYHLRNDASIDKSTRDDWALAPLETYEPTEVQWVKGADGQEVPTGYGTHVLGGG